MIIRRSTSWIAAALAAVLLAIALPAGPARADDEYVLYYTVTSAYQNSPENLAEIATRFLGDAARANEVFNLNTGRRQPDGGVLGDPNKLTAGWYLVLPWDAVGAGVQYGVLPSTTPAPNGTGAPAPGPGATGAPAPGQTGGGLPANPPPAPSGTAGPASPAPSGSPQPPPSGKCVAATAASAPSNWAMARVAPDQAWPYTRGLGVSVAVVDSGVDPRAPQFGSQVGRGEDIVTGADRGDADCLGTGTAMAGLVVARPTEKDTFSGIAPDAVVMPIRLVNDNTTVDKARQATAIEVAISTGANVIALGSYVDITSDAVARGVQKALDAGISVVAAAPTAAAGAVTPPEDVILVGGVGVDNKLAAEYVADTVDVVAPGINISSTGINGTTFVGSGTQYAVAQVAGVVALIRASKPGLNAAQITHRLQATADAMGDGQPNANYGYGMINPLSAVTRELPDEATLISSDGNGAEPVSGGNEIRIAFLLTVLAGLVLSALLVFRFRRTMRTADVDDDLDTEWPAGDPDSTRPAAPSAPGPR